MISPMTKYSFVLLSEQTEGFLSKIQDLGVIDITRSLKPVDGKSEALLSEADQAKKALAILNACTLAPELGFKFDGDPVQAVLAAEDKVNAVKVEISTAKREVAVRRPWGEFSSEDLQKLESKGQIGRAHV